MAFAKGNLEKFLEDTPQLRERKDEILKQAAQYVEQDGVTMVAQAAIILLGPQLAHAFLHLLETDFDHMQIFVDELRGRR